jgi:hypothetical protein
MDGTVRRLFGAAVTLALFSAASWYAGSRMATPGPAPSPENALGRQFATDPGDGWMLFGGFLLIVAVAVACAGAMLWAHEAKDER